MNVALLTTTMSRRGGGVWEFIRHVASGLSKSGITASVVGLRDCRASGSDLTCLSELKVIACDVTGPDAFGFSRGMLPGALPTQSGRSARTRRLDVPVPGQPEVAPTIETTIHGIAARHA